MPTEFCIARADLYIKQHCLNWQKKKKDLQCLHSPAGAAVQEIRFQSDVHQEGEEFKSCWANKDLTWVSPQTNQSCDWFRVVSKHVYSVMTLTLVCHHWFLNTTYWSDVVFFCLFVFNHLSCGMDHLLSADTIRKQWGVWPITDCTRCLPRRRMMAQW